MTQRGYFARLFEAHPPRPDLDLSTASLGEILREAEREAVFAQQLRALDIEIAWKLAGNRPLNNVWHSSQDGRKNIKGNQLSERGGKREGSGRKPGSLNKATAEVRALALEYGPAAIEELAKLGGLVKDDDGAALGIAQSETARISSCNSILERAYGNASPGRPIVLDIPDTSNVDGVTQAIASIIQTAASGEITPAEAGDFCALLEAQRRAIELSDIELRLSRLEAANEASNDAQDTYRQVRGSTLAEC
jgi:hypothetical protein